MTAYLPEKNYSDKYMSRRFDNMEEMQEVKEGIERYS